MKKATKLTEQEIKHFGRLANLPLDAKERKNLQKQLSDALLVVAKLSEIDTSNVEETSHATGLENVMREDEVDVGQNLPSKDTLANASDVHNNLFRVQAIFENES